MTTQDQVRRSRPSRRVEEAARSIGIVPPPGLSERLLAARERKGVDLYRAERDTKIRARYLAALERGEFRELPGTVYTKGFLRNYALYLGLNPDEILDLWHRERGAAASEPVLVVPRAIQAPRQGLVLSRSMLVAALLSVGVLIFVGYLGLQLFRFAQPPAIIVSDPPTVVSTVEDDLTSYVLRGSSVANATVSIDTPGRDTLRVSADPQGRWEATVELRRGRNQFDVAATDPDTGKRSNDTIRLFITVPFTVVQAPTLTLESPADGASFENGAIPVQGRAANAARVTVSATYVGPAPGQRSSGPLPRAPGAESVKVGSDGDFTVPYELSTGRWTLTITAASDQNKTTTLTRAITIDYQGVNLVIQIKGGRAWLKVWVDGEPDAGVGAGGRTYNEGKKLTFSAKHSIEVLTGSSGYTYFTLNGQPLGPLGKPKVVETWLFQPPDQPRQTSRR